MKFTELNLIRPILKAVAQEGYEQPSPIQEQAIPLILKGRDIFGCAQTGTGKTAAFAIPILQLLYQQRKDQIPANRLQALVLTPTRELAAQVGQSFEAYGRHTGLRTTVIFGGVGQAPQVEALRRGVDILVATPGRLNDLIGQGLCDLRGITKFVLDEADRMLDMGFFHDVKKVIKQLPEKRQTLLFSATMPSEITELAASILHEPITVAVTPVSSTVEIIEQSLYFVDKLNKGKLLIELLKSDEIVSALVFSRTKHGANRIDKMLSRAGVATGVIHGDKSQGARLTALADFKAGKTRILVATDIAARGLDIDELSHVINYDLPNEPETYVHRIGRTGRAGLSGVAISFCDISEQGYLKEIQKLIGETIPVVEEHPYPMEVFEVPPPQPRPPRPPRATRGTSKAPAASVVAATPTAATSAAAKDRDKAPSRRRRRRRQK